MSEEILMYIIIIGIPIVCYTIYEIIDRVCECREKRSMYERYKNKDE